MDSVLGAGGVHVLTENACAALPTRLAADICKTLYLPEFDLPGHSVLSRLSLRLAAVHAVTIVAPGDRHVLAIRGTTERRQWWRYNLRFLPMVAEGDTRRWHRGFLEMAETVYAWARDRHIDAVTGHSLGGAVAQIVAPSLRLPAVTFGAPRPLWHAEQPEGANTVINICRADDTVARRPWRQLGFRHVGRTVWFTPKEHHRGLDHGLDAYCDALDGLEHGYWSEGD